MKQSFAVCFVALCAVCFVWLVSPFERAQKSNAQTTAPRENLVPVFKQAFKFAVSAPVRAFAPAPLERGGSSRKIERGKNFAASAAAREIGGNTPRRQEPANAKHDRDAAFAKQSDAAMPAPILTFDGLSSKDTAVAFGFWAIPPDMNGDVGLNHYVQATNLLVRVFDKSGAPLAPAFKLSSVYANLGTTCAQRDDGEPIVLYDQLADRWILSSYCSAAPPFRQMIAVSETGDPLGRYYVYEFVMPNNKLNDYAKLAVWRDAFLMTTDQFVGQTFAGSGAFAFDRAKMLRGDWSAGYVYFDLASPSTTRLGGMLPADLDGLQPPPQGAPGIFVSYTANEYGDGADAIKLFDFKPNFETPRASTFRERAESPLAVAAFDPTSPPDRQDIRQPAPGDFLDSQSDRLMYRVAYRNFGDSESLVFNQTVRVSGQAEDYRAGVRLYELRKSANENSFAVQTQATAAFDDLSRWMGSAAQDNAGNLAVGYSTSSAASNPSIAYTGRAATDAPNVLRAETVLHKGSGVQKAFGFRWGDYSAMSVDPVDDCTFWYTNEYYTTESQAESDYSWLTRIGKFKFPECQNAQRGSISGTITNAATGQPIQNATVGINSIYSRATGQNGDYNFALAPDSYSITISANGFRAQTANVFVSDGASVAQNFALQPSFAAENAAIEIAAESCARNNAIEPGETVTINLPIRNRGAAASDHLIVELLARNGVTNVSAAQDYGAIAVGQIVSRAFTFTAAPDLACGANLTLTFRLSDSNETVGDLAQIFAAGEQKFVLRERFDRAPIGKLPGGWTTGATGAQTIWQTVRERSNSYPNAMFSPEAYLAGVNELVSPSLDIATANAVLKFQNKYDLESTFLRNKLYDGGVLEIKIGANDWTDIIAAGGEFVSGAYDGALDSCCQNPLAGRAAWSGRSGVETAPQFVAAEILLPASTQNQTIRLRWRVATDTGGRRTGQWIDDVSVADGFACGCGQ